MLIAVPTITVSYRIQVDRLDDQGHLASSLSVKDKRLKVKVPPQEGVDGNIENLAKWIKSVSPLSVKAGDYMRSAKDYFVFGEVNAGDLMEAYAALYRLRWVAYRSGKPNYELIAGKDQMDHLYYPQNDFQKQRFAATASFISLFDKMGDEDREKVLGGSPLEYSELSEEMKDSFKKAIEAAISVKNSSAPDKVSDSDANNISRATIEISDRSEPGTGVREMWITADTNVGGYSFRWNNYDPKKGIAPNERPTMYIQGPPENENFNRDLMLKQSKRLASLLITVPEEERTMEELLKYISTNYGVNFITNKDVSNKPLMFSCKDLPFAEAMDKISKQYGDWEWEISPGDFVVMRSKEAPRRRKMMPKAKNT